MLLAREEMKEMMDGGQAAMKPRAFRRRPAQCQEENEEIVLSFEY